MTLSAIAARACIDREWTSQKRIIVDVVAPTLNGPPISRPGGQHLRGPLQRIHSLGTVRSKWTCYTLCAIPKKTGDAGANRPTISRHRRGGMTARTAESGALVWRHRAARAWSALLQCSDVFTGSSRLAHCAYRGFRDVSQSASDGTVPIGAHLALNTRRLPSQIVEAPRQAREAGRHTQSVTELADRASNTGGHVP